MMVLLNAKELNVHINRHDGNTSNQCQQCEAEFPGNELLDIRRRICNVDHLFWCAVCGSSFANKSHLQKHIIGHMAKKPHCKDVKPLVACCINPRSPSMEFQPCKNSASRVAKSVAAREALSLSANGVESTLSMKPYIDDDFLQKHVKLYEQQTHFPEQPMYTCHTCNEDFADLFKLKLHIVRSHLGATPYKCLEVGCEASFANQTTLRKHMSVVHSDIIPYKCKQCLSKFKFLSDLFKHVRRHHPHNERYARDVSKAAPLKQAANDSMSKKFESGNGWEECCGEHLCNGLSTDAKNEHAEYMGERNASILAKQVRIKTSLTIAANPKGTDSKLDSRNPINDSQVDIFMHAGPKCEPELTWTDLLNIGGCERFFSEEVSDGMNKECQLVHGSNSEEVLGTNAKLHNCTEPLSAVYGKKQLPYVCEACIAEFEKRRILQAQFECILQSKDSTRNSSSVQKDETKFHCCKEGSGINRPHKTTQKQHSNSVKASKHTKSNKLKPSNALQWGQGPIIINARQEDKYIPYRCKLCNVDFYFCRQLLSHIKRVHDYNRCNFFTKLHRRKQTNINKVLYVCKQCNIQYKQYSMYVRHRRDIHGKNNPFPENTPRTACSNKSCLRRTTIKVKTRQKTHYQCAKCDVKFKRCGELLLHVRQSHEISVKENGTQTVQEQQNVDNNITTLPNLEGTNCRTEESHRVSAAATNLEVEKEIPSNKDVDTEVQQLCRKRHEKHRQITDSPKHKKRRKTRNTLKMCKSDATKMGFNKQYSTEGEKVINSCSAEGCEPALKQLYGIREHTKCSATGYGDAHKSHQCRVCKTQFKHCHEFVNRNKCVQKIWKSELPIKRIQPTESDEYHIHTEYDSRNKEQTESKPLLQSSKFCGMPSKRLGKPRMSNYSVQNQAGIKAHIKENPTVKENHYLCQCCNTDFKQMNELLKHFLRHHYRIKESVSVTNGNPAFRQPTVAKVAKCDSMHNLWMTEQSIADYGRWCELVKNATTKSTEVIDTFSKYCRGKPLSEKIDALENTDHIKKVLYRCEECNAKFNQLEALLKHRLIHSSCLM